MSNLQEKIIQRMKVKPMIDPAVEIERSIQFMTDYLLAHPFFKSLVLGISGGQDSTLLGKLAQLTVDRLRKETQDGDYRFIAVRLPYGQQIDEDDAQSVLEWIRPDQVVTVNIQPAVDANIQSLVQAGVEITDFNKGNIKARERMIVQYAIAGEYQGVVLGSDHAAENVTGFFTKHGDGASDIVPLFRLNKRQGAQMLQYLNAPKIFYEKVPTADLEDDRPAQADEEALGISYQAIDDYLEGKNVSHQDQTVIEDLYVKSEHKRHLPVTLFDDFWK